MAIKDETSVTVGKSGEGVCPGVADCLAGEPDSVKWKGFEVIAELKMGRLVPDAGAKGSFVLLAPDTGTAILGPWSKNFSTPACGLTILSRR